MKRRYSTIVKKIAKQNGVSPEYVYAQIQQAITEGYNNPDPTVQEHWRKIAPDGTLPSPEEVIEILAKESKNKR